MMIKLISSYLPFPIIHFDKPVIIAIGVSPENAGFIFSDQKIKKLELLTFPNKASRFFTTSDLWVN